jgi:hypothetical protein
MDERELIRGHHTSISVVYHAPTHTQRYWIARAILMPDKSANRRLSSKIAREAGIRLNFPSNAGTVPREIAAEWISVRIQEFALISKTQVGPNRRSSSHCRIRGHIENQRLSIVSPYTVLKNSW